MLASPSDASTRVGRTGTRTGRLVVLLGPAAALLCLSLLWNLPDELAEFVPERFITVPLEVAVLLGLLALAAPLRSGRKGLAFAVAVGVASAALVVVQVAGVASHATLARPLNPLVDLHLAASLVHLLTEAFGPLGWLALGLLLAIPLATFALSLAAVRSAQHVLQGTGARSATLLACAAIAGLFVFQELLPEAFGHRRPVSDQASATIAKQWRLGRDVLRQQAVLEQAIANDRFATKAPDRVLNGLGGADVLLMFVESYGRSGLELPRYAEILRPTLEDFQDRLDARGLRAASGWLTSPTVGGQSWLAHATLEGGLWIANQVHYDLLLRSERLTLTRAFAKAGYRTVALKPAITRPWPEGDRLGFARIYAAADMSYAGKPYNWVTMPDQFTLAVMEREERARAGTPLFVEVSLISSHAPFTPVAPILDDWSAIGDGAVFSPFADRGDPPEVVWRDPERVRHQYALALDYVLEVLGSYAATFVDERTLLIVVGDHQPSPLITGEGAGRDVPIHVISGDPDLLAPFMDWGFAHGMQPADGAAAKPMDGFRDWFLDAFGEAATPQ